MLFKNTLANSLRSVTLGQLALSQNFSLITLLREACTFVALVISSNPVNFVLVIITLPISSFTEAFRVIPLSSFV